LKYLLRYPLWVVTSLVESSFLEAVYAAIRFGKEIKCCPMLNILQSLSEVCFNNWCEGVTLISTHLYQQFTSPCGQCVLILKSSLTMQKSVSYIHNIYKTDTSFLIYFTLSAELQ
jgi:hypothetical protein